MWSVNTRPKIRSASFGRGLGEAVSWIEIVVAVAAIWVAILRSGPEDNAPARLAHHAARLSGATAASAAERWGDPDDLLRAQATDQRQVGGDLGLLGREQPVQVVDAGDGLAVEADDEIAVLDPGARGWAVGLDRYDEHPGLDRQLVVTDDAPVQRHVLPRDADEAAPDPPVAHQQPHHEAGGVDRDREADP